MTFTTTPLVAIADGIQGQWVSENLSLSQFGEKNRYTKISTASKGGRFDTSRLDNVTGLVSTFLLATNESDDHNVSSDLELPDGTWLTFWNRHSISGTGFRMRRTQTPGLMDYGPTVVVAGSLTPSDGNKLPCYLQSKLVGNRIYVTHRVGNSGNGFWVIRWSDDWGYTWSAEKQLTPVPYMSTAWDGNTMHGVMYSHPVNHTDHNIYTFSIDLVTGDVSAKGVVIGNLFTHTTGPIVTVTNARKAVVITTGTSRLFSQSKDGKYIYAMEMSGVNGVGHCYRYVRTPGTGAYTKQFVSTTGKAFLAGSQGYFGGHAQLDENHILVSINLSGNVGVGSWKFVIMKTTDDGATWTELHTITTTSNIVARPQVIGDMIFWSEMSYYATYKLFTSKVMYCKCTILPPLVIGEEEPEPVLVEEAQDFTDGYEILPAPGPVWTDLEPAYLANVEAEGAGVWVGTPASASSNGRFLANVSLDLNGSGWVSCDFPVENDASGSIAFDPSSANALTLTENDFFVKITKLTALSRGNNGGDFALNNDMVPGPDAKMRCGRDTDGKFKIQRSYDAGATWATVYSWPNVNWSKMRVRLYLSYSPTTAPLVRRMYRPKWTGAFSAS